MKKIVIFEDGSSNDGCGCCLGVVFLILLIVCGIAIWPVMIGTAEDDITSFLMVSGIIIGSCVTTTVVYRKVDKDNIKKRSFFAIFGIIYVFTAIMSGILLHIAFDLTEEPYGSSHDAMVIIMTAVMVSILPSVIAVAVCKLLKSK